MTQFFRCDKCGYETAESLNQYNVLGNYVHLCTSCSVQGQKMVRKWLKDGTLMGASAGCA